MSCRRIPAISAIVVVSLVVAACGGGGPPADPGHSDNPEAMVAFDSANVLWGKPGRTGAEMEESANLLERAVQLDPDFAMAHAYLAGEDAWIHQNWDRTPERAARALAAAQRAVTLAPDLSQAHTAMGAYYYRIAKDYEAALGHYKRAQELNPGDAAALRMTGYVARRAGRMDEAVALLEEAATLSVNRASAWDLGNTYSMMGRYDEARAAYQEAHDTAPDHWQPPHALVWLDIHERGDLTALRALLDEADGGYIGNRWWLAMVDHDWAAAVAAMEAPGADPFSGAYGLNPRGLMRGLAHRRMGDETRARAEFETARQMMEEQVAETPDDPRPYLSMGLALAALGMKDEGIAAGRKGVELLPPDQDALIGPNSQWWLMEIYATAGEPELALAELESILSGPLPGGAPTMGLDPWMYTLADHPRFKELTGTD